MKKSGIDIRKNKNPEQKRVSYKNALKLVKSYTETKHYLGAYVLLFSILEDRVNALYAVRFFTHLGKTAPTENGGIGRIQFKKRISDLRKEKDLDVTVVAALTESAKNRNSIVHAALWHNEELSEDIINELMTLMRKVDSARKAQKKALNI